MKPIIWDNIRFRASSWGNLLTEPRSKSEGALSVTCQKELIKIYNREVYGRIKDITTKQMDKGITFIWRLTPLGKKALEWNEAVKMLQ